MATQRLTRAESREQTRKRLLAAAARLFAKNGFDGTSVEDVAEAAGFSKGALYYNFASKDDLFEALVEESVAEMIGGLEAALAGAHTIEDKLASMQRILTEEEAHPGGGTQLLELEVITQALRDRKLRRTVGKAYTHMRDAIASLIEEQYAEAGAKPPLSPDHLAIAIMAGSLGTGLMQALDPDAVPPGLLPSVVALLLRP
jgi:AcrR family transcriptional regulator